MLHLSTLEQSRFGCVTARARIRSASELDEAYRFCADHAVALLIARIDTIHLDLVQRLTADGAVLCDTLVVLRRDLTQDLAVSPPSDGTFTIRAGLPSDATSVQAIAAPSFHDYRGHYHADRRLDRRAADAAYVEWAVRLCAGDDGTSLQVAEAHGEIAGFFGFRRNGPDQVAADLLCVAPSWRGRGVAGRLLRAQMALSQRLGVACMVYPTQIANVASQAVAIRNGFVPYQSTYTLHRWFEP